MHCIVESCWDDPRIIKVPVDRFNGPSASDVSLQRLASRPAGSTATVVVSDGSDPRAAAMAAPVAAVVDGPLLLIEPSGPSPAHLAELQRLGAKRIVVVGPSLLASAVGPLSQTGAGIDVIHDPLDIASASVAVANWVLQRTGGRRLWCIGAGGVASDSAAAVGSLAMADRAPVVIGIDACNAVRNGPFGTGGMVPVFVGPEPAAVADAGGDVITGQTAVEVVAGLAKRALGLAGTGRTAVAFAPARTPAVAAGLMAPGGAMVLHEDGMVTAALRDWCNAIRGSVGRGEVATGAPGSLPDQGVYDLQSAFNNFDAHQLIGIGGQGLPVYPQPNEEREQGKARVSGPLPSTTTSTTLVARANPARQTGATSTTSTTVAGPARPGHVPVRRSGHEDRGDEAGDDHDAAAGERPAVTATAAVTTIAMVLAAVAGIRALWSP